MNIFKPRFPQNHTVTVNSSTLRTTNLKLFNTMKSYIVQLQKYCCYACICVCVSGSTSNEASTHILMTHMLSCNVLIPKALAGFENLRESLWNYPINTIYELMLWNLIVFITEPIKAKCCVSEIRPWRIFWSSLVYKTKENHLYFIRAARQTVMKLQYYHSVKC